MGQGESLSSVRKEWLSWLLWMEILVAIWFLQVTMGDEIGVPATNLLCISNCATCPSICSPPPASTSLPPPSPPTSPSPGYSPPLLYYFPPLPPPPPTPPPPHSSSSYSSPPPSYSSQSSSRPPPSPKTNLNTPPAPMPPSAFPYYYFYASRAASFSLPAFMSYFVTSILCLSIVFTF